MMAAEAREGVECDGRWEKVKEAEKGGGKGRRC